MLRTTDTPLAGERGKCAEDHHLGDAHGKEMGRRWARLVGPWVSELRNTWAKARRSREKRACIIDLSDVTFIDEDGERLLRAMSKRGAQFVADGIYTRHVLEQLGA